MIMKPPFFIFNQYSYPMQKVIELGPLKIGYWRRETKI